MTNPSLSETELKNLIKAAILEIFQERRDLFQDIISEALEGMVLVKAIDAGKDSETVSKETLLSDPMLAEEWLTPEEDEAWKNL